MQKVEILPAQPENLPDLLRMIQALASFEGIPDQVRASLSDLQEALFTETPKAFALMAFVDGAAAGYVLLVPLVYVKRAACKLVLEDFYVAEAYRGHGLGRFLMETTIRFARDNGYFKIEWGVLNWNESAHAFYQRFNAQPNTTWTSYQLLLQ